MNRALVLKIVKTELGPPETVFKSFDLVPFAAASLGQVHRATSEEGRDLAVKIQYPGMREGVQSDLDLLKGVLAPTKYSRIFKHCFPEVARKVHEELNYKTEARRTEHFKAVIPETRFVSPDVIEALSTERVLTTTRIGGLHLSSWLETRPSKAERDHFGQRLVDFFNFGVFTLSTIHADPNPGNFLFREDGRLGIIDFGCVKNLSPTFVKAIGHLLKTEDKVETALEEQTTLLK